MYRRLAQSLILFLLLILSAVGQKGEKGKPVTSPPIGVSTGLPFYPMDDAAKLHIRDLEFKANQLEIEIQSMRAKIEENKAAEAALWKEVQTVASQYAKDKNIDPTDFDFDAAEAKFLKKKKP